MWYNNGDSSLGDANWGYMNLDQWNVDVQHQLPQRGFLRPPGLDPQRLSDILHV